MSFISSDIRPDCRREKSSRSSTSRACRVALSAIDCSARARRAASSTPCCSIEVQPRMALSGVRSSCDTIDTNSSLCRLARFGLGPRAIGRFVEARALDRLRAVLRHRRQQVPIVVVEIHRRGEVKREHADGFAVDEQRQRRRRHVAAVGSDRGRSRVALLPLVERAHEHRRARADRLGRAQARLGGLARVPSRRGAAGHRRTPSRTPCRRPRAWRDHRSPRRARCVRAARRRARPPRAWPLPTARRPDRAAAWSARPARDSALRSARSAASTFWRSTSSRSARCAKRVGFGARRSAPIRAARCDRAPAPRACRAPADSRGRTA